jgi:hypothetical protein
LPSTSTSLGVHSQPSPGPLATREPVKGGWDSAGELHAARAERDAQLDAALGWRELGADVAGADVAEAGDLEADDAGRD